MKTVSTVLLILAASVAPAFAAAPAWDSSGNSQLTGTYYFRQVIYVTDAGGNTSRAISLYGNIAFSGATTGTYVLSGLGQADSSGQGASVTTTGTYSVSASGYGFLSDPSISGANIYFLVSKGILIGSSTESGYNDMFVAAPATANATLSGTYTIAGFFPGGTAATATDVNYQITPNNGSLGLVTISGTTGAGTAANQTSTGVTYKFSNGAAAINFPTNTNANFYSGVNSIFMYVSPDSNFVFGGSPNGFDMFVGVKNAASGATPLSGLYYEAGLDENTVDGLDSYYGSFNTFTGNIIGHERITYSDNGSASAEGFTYYSSYPITLAGSYQDTYGTTKYTIGANGFRIGAGIGPYLSIEVAVPYTPPVVTTGTYIDPSGIVNSASSAPYTAGISPGEFLTLYNNNGTSFAPAGSLIIAPGLPTLTTSLAGIKVLVDGLPAPIYYVTANSISFVVPYEVSQQLPVASIQVSNNGALSNVVTMYVHQTATGVFTVPQGGISIAATLDFPASGPYYIVSANTPANPGDYVAVYLTGLGTPFPANQDGLPGGTACVSGVCLANSLAVDVGGVPVSPILFAGTAPDEVPGLYQLNFQIPPICATAASTSCLTTAGSYNLGISGIVAVPGGTAEDSYSNEALLPVGSGSTSSAVASADTATAKTLPAAHRAPPRLRAVSR